MIRVVRVGDKLLIQKWYYGTRSGRWIPVAVIRYDCPNPQALDLVYPDGKEHMLGSNGLDHAIRLTETEYLRYMLLWRIGKEIVPPIRRKKCNADGDR